MARDETPGSVQRSRGVLALAGILLLVTSGWFATSWIDAEYDATCGALIYPSMWLDSAAPPECRSTMAVRWGITVVLSVVGAGFLLVALTGGSRLPARSSKVILAMAVPTSVVVLLINEAVRSHGAL